MYTVYYTRSHYNSHYTHTLSLMVSMSSQEDVIRKTSSGRRRQEDAIRKASLATTASS